MTDRTPTESPVSPAPQRHHTAKVESRSMIGVRAAAMGPDEYACALVLVVEDEPLVRELVCERILELGHDVISVDRADKAIDYLEHNAVDVALVISDIRMPGGLDGCQLATLITLRWPGLPVLLSLGFSDAQLHHLRPGTLFIGKPWRFEQMKRRLGSTCQPLGIIYSCYQGDTALTRVLEGSTPSLGARACLCCASPKKIVGEKRF